MREEQQIKKILKRHDPVSISSARMEKLYARIFDALDAPEEQQLFVSPAASVSMSAPFSFRFISAGALVLVLGLFVGQNFNVSPTVQTAAVQSPEQISVVAMAEPWENFIVKE